INAAIRPELHVSRQHVRNKYFPINQLKAGSFRFRGEGMNQTVGGGTFEVTQEKMIIVLFRQADAGIIGQTRRAVANDIDRRNKKRSLAIELRVALTFVE